MLDTLKAYQAYRESTLRALSRPASEREEPH
jgi:hypothetical protein